MRILAVLIVFTMASAGCLSGLTGGVDPYDILTDDKYTKWVIEVDYTPGEQPSSSVLGAMTSRMKALAQKDSITTVTSDTNLPSQAKWTRSDLDKLHSKYQDEKTGGSTVTTHLMFVDGKYEKENVLGVAVGHDYVVIFSERIAESCASNLLCGGSDETRIRQAVLTHEFGHIIGLVDNGIPMATNHGDGGGHSASENSVMYASAETTGIFGLATIPMNFDANDKADVCKAGGKCS